MGAGLQSVENTHLLSALCPVNEYSLLHHWEIKAIKLKMFCGVVSVILYTISLLSSAVPDKLDIIICILLPSSDQDSSTLLFFC